MADDRFVRTARISWRGHPPDGHARATVGTRALTSLPLAFQAADSDPDTSNVGELLAAAHGGALTQFVVRALMRDGVSLSELTVAVT